MVEGNGRKERRERRKTGGRSRLKEEGRGGREGETMKRRGRGKGQKRKRKQTRGREGRGGKRRKRRTKDRRDLLLFPVSERNLVFLGRLGSSFLSWKSKTSEEGGREGR